MEQDSHVSSHSSIDIYGLRTISRLFAAAPKELYWLLGDSACFGNDEQAQAGGSLAYLPATESGVSFFNGASRKVISYCFRAARRGV